MNIPKVAREIGVSAATLATSGRPDTCRSRRSAPASLEPRAGGTVLSLKWVPIEYTEAALAMFVNQMASMADGWGGRFGKLDEWLATPDLSKAAHPGSGSPVSAPGKD